MAVAPLAKKRFLSRTLLKKNMLKYLCRYTGNARWLELVGSENLTAGAGWSMQQAQRENLLLSISPAPEHAENNINSTRGDFSALHMKFIYEYFYGRKQ